ncbi:MAG TPA: hypothetical protein VK897_25280 [Anaerolineales bacterium]|nr:hypothetical protein [Anaerolineales bacterium]
MPDFSAFVPETHQNISSGYVETLIQARREELFTGLMRLRYPGGEHLVFTFLEGIQQKLYRCSDNTMEVLPRHTWFYALDHPDASVGFLSLPVEAMRFTRVAYEAPVIHMEQSTYSREELMECAGRWSVEAEPGIVHLQCDPWDRYYLIAGHTTPIIEELSMANGRPNFSISDATFPQSLPNGRYQVARYISNCEHEVWREYELRLAFGPLMRMLLNRFSELAGRVLTERLCVQLSLWTREEGWNISITSNGAVNRHYFDSLESAIGVYLDLLRRFREEASPAIGSRMVDTISREILNKLDPYRRELLTQYLYSQFGVGSISGVVWR